MKDRDQPDDSDSAIHLHSNMDRFENLPRRNANRATVLIYIPIWIDLKSGPGAAVGASVSNLHSNMDRFEKQIRKALKRIKDAFTFQYG